MWAQVGSYAPKPIEVLIVIGVISLGTLAFMVLSTKLLKSSSSADEVAGSAAESVA
jgi:molybdopterin-containing oxidoreductase family membrane subunit